MASTPEYYTETPWSVRALTRVADREEKLHDLGADAVVVGDLLDPSDAQQAVQEVDAVVCCVGSSLREILAADELVDRPGVVNLARAAADTVVEQFVFQSAFGVGASHDRVPLWYRVPIARPLEAKGRAEDVLRSVDVEHTIVRPGILTNGPARGYPLVVEGGDTLFGLISRADIARLLFAALDAPASSGRTFEVVSRRWTWGSVPGTVDLDWTLPGRGGGPTVVVRCMWPTAAAMAALNLRC